jgi:hypothetical protein
MSGSFEPVAAWYDEHVGEDGSFYHRHLILPAAVPASPAWTSPRR